MNAVLLEFLRTGELGPLKCGLPREEVRRLLGDPQSWDGYEHQAARWGFEALSVDFEGQHVIGYGLGFNSRWPLPNCINGLAAPAYLEISMEQVRQELSSVNIFFEHGRDDKRMIRTKGGVWVFPSPQDNVMSMVFACPGQNRLQWLEDYFRGPAHST